MGDMIKVLFYVRKSKTNSGGLSPVYLRVTVNGQRFGTATSRFVESNKWSQVGGRAIGSAKEVKELNEFLDVLRAKAFGIQKYLITIGLGVTIELFIKHWNGVKEKERMLLEIFQHHNDQVRELIGRQYSPSTHKRYETSLEHTRKFIALRHLNISSSQTMSFGLRQKGSAITIAQSSTLPTSKRLFISASRTAGWIGIHSLALK